MLGSDTNLDCGFNFSLRIGAPLSHATSLEEPGYDSIVLISPEIDAIKDISSDISTLLSKHNEVNVNLEGALT